MNYYELLGISIDATDDEIKSAYKREIKKWHPDVNKDEEAVTISMKLNEAKTTLLDKEKRLEYDNFINHKEADNYQRYTNVRPQEEDIEVPQYEEYEERLVTKWEYLKEYLFTSNINIFRRIISLIFVLLETFLCFLLKCIIIGLSFLCFILSDLIIFIFRFLSPVAIILILYMVYIIVSKGFNGLITNNILLFKGVIIYIIVYIIGIFLPIIGKKLISQDVFELLYNKLDVFLFKKSVGYK